MTISVARQDFILPDDIIIPNINIAQRKQNIKNLKDKKI